MKICVVGSGYVGLVTGACLADFGMTVIGVDKDAAKVDGARAGRDPDLRARPRETWSRRTCARAGCASPPTSAPAIREARAVFIAVGTPPLPDGSADLSLRPRRWPSRSATT